MIISTKGCKYSLSNIIILWKEAIPKGGVLISYAVAFVIGCASRVMYEEKNLKVHIFIGLLIAGVNVLYVWKSYREIYRSIKSGHHD